MNVGRKSAATAGGGAGVSEALGGEMERRGGVGGFCGVGVGEEPAGWADAVGVVDGGEKSGQNN